MTRPAKAEPTGETVQLGFRVPAALATRLRREAARQQLASGEAVTATDLVVIALDAYLRRREARS